jgi:hypothetical protein
MYRAGARASRIAARSTRTAADPGIRIRTGADGKDRQLFFECLAMAGGAGGLITLPRQELEAMAAIATGILEKRHGLLNLETSNWVIG